MFMMGEPRFYGGNQQMLRQRARFERVSGAHPERLMDKIGHPRQRPAHVGQTTPFRWRGRDDWAYETESAARQSRDTTAIPPAAADSLPATRASGGRYQLKRPVPGCATRNAVIDSHDTMHPHAERDALHASHASEAK